MDRPASNSSARRYRAYISSLGKTQLHLRSPIVVAWYTLGSLRTGC